MHDPKLTEFIRLFNTEQFFEAHEVLEELWLQTTGENKRFYQGLIQCAVAFAHWQRKNPKGAQQVGSRALAILKTFDPCEEGIEVLKLIRESEILLGGSGVSFPQIEIRTD